MHRRIVLIVLALCASCTQQPVAQNQQQPLANPLDAVAVYIIPTDDVAEQAAGTIARTLTKDTGLWIKSTVWAPSDVSEPFPGTNQYPAEDYFPVGTRVAQALRDASANTYFIVLTNRDINSKTLNFRFQYSMHSPMVNTSVLSIARLLYNVDGSKATENVATERVTKMLMRIIGEMRLGWKRTSDPKSLMYAPIMSIEDIDRMTLSCDQITQDKQMMSNPAVAAIGTKSCADVPTPR